MSADNRTGPEYQAHCDELAKRVSEVLDGEELSDVASVLAGLAAYAILTRCSDPVERMEMLSKLFGFMWRTADLGHAEIEIKPEGGHGRTH